MPDSNDLVVDTPLAADLRQEDLRGICFFVDNVMVARIGLEGVETFGAHAADKAAKAFWQTFSAPENRGFLTPLLEEAAAREREACAEVAEGFEMMPDFSAAAIAAAIRARGA